MKSNNIVKIGIDVGGTFTDIILADMSNNKFYEEKVLTDHANPRIAILEGLTKILGSIRPVGRKINSTISPLVY